MILPFKRLVTHLVLVSFFFQTIWPSVAFATEVDVLRLPPPASPLLAPAVIAVAPFTLRAFVDEQAEGFDDIGPKPVLSFPGAASIFEAQQWLNTSVEARELYPGLVVTEQGIIWSQYGLGFLMAITGDLLVRPLSGVRPTSKTLRLYNPHGNLMLGGGLTMDAIQAYACNVLQVGATPSVVERLEIWATGKSQQPGSFVVGDKAKLQVKDLSVYAGQSENHGELTVVPEGTLQLSGQTFSNYQHLALGKEAQVKGSYTFANYGSVDGEEYLVSSVILHNDSTGKIEGRNVSLLVQELFINNGAVATQQRTNLVALGSVRNLGTLTSQGQQFIAVTKDFYNRGTVQASQQTLRVGGKTLNEGKIKGEELALQLTELDNCSLIQAGRRLEGSWTSGRNSGLIRSKGSAAVMLLGDFVNERFIESVQDSVYEVSEGMTFANQGQLTSAQKLTLKGKGQVENKGVIEAQREALLQIAIFHNHRLVKAQGGLRLSVGGVFHNHATGVLSSGGQTTFSGEGTFINEAQETGGAADEEPTLGLISAGDIVFNRFTGSIENRGLIYTLQRVTGQVRSCHNHHRMQAEQGYGLTIEDFHNAGNWSGQGKLIVTRGRNVGWISTSALEIEVQERFTQEATGTLQVKAGLTLTGTGEVLNEGLIHTPALTIGTGTFENRQRIISGEVKVLPTTRRFSQGKDAFFEAQTVEFGAGGRVEVVNQGNWSIGKALRGTVGSWHNLRKIMVEGDPTLNKLTVLGRLVTAADSHWELSGLTLEVKGEWLHNGVLCLRGNSALEAQILRNSGKIGRAEGAQGTLDVMVGTLENQGTLGFYHVNLTVRDNLITTAASKLTAAERFVLHYDKAYEHYGDLYAKDFTYQGKGYGSKLVNKGTIVATQKTLIEAEFDNPAQGAAELTGLTLRVPGYETDYFFNNGKLTLQRVQSLGTKKKHLHNGHGAILALLDNGYGSLIERKLVGRGLTFKQVTNYGTLALGTGTYWVEEGFKNYGTQQALGGQDLWCGDIVNDGLIYAEPGLRVDQTRAVFTKLGKIKVDKDLILDFGSRPAVADYIRENAPNWDIAKGALRVRTDDFVNTKELGLGFPVYIMVRDAFANTSKIHARELHVRARTFKQGRLQSSFNEYEGYEEIEQHLGELKSDGVLTAEIDEDVDNQVGAIEAKGEVSLISRRGRILNGHPIAGNNYWHHKGKAFISSGRKLTLKGSEVLNTFGELVGNGGLEAVTTSQIHNLSGIIRVNGNAVFQGPMFHNQKSAPYRDGSGQGHYGANFDCQYCYVPTGEASQLLVTGNIYFQVTALVNEASHITSFGVITDKYGIVRTQSNPGYFQHITRLIRPAHGAVKGCGDDRGRSAYGGELKEEGSFSSATRVEMGFAHNRIEGAKLASADIHMRGQHLLVTDGGTTRGGGETVMPRTTRQSLLPALRQLAGGDLMPQSRTANPATVYSSRTSTPTKLSLSELTVVATDMAQTVAAGASRDHQRILMDYLSLAFSLQSVLSTTWGRGYIYPKRDADAHLQTLLSNARGLLKGQVALTRRQAEQASIPLITFEEEDIDGERNVLVPYVTLPARFQNLFLLSPGAVIDSDEKIDIDMTASITTQSATIHAVDDVRLYTDGTRVSQTLKDTSVIQQGKTTIVQDVARQQDRVISDRGKIVDQSRGDFTSQGVYRQAASGVTLGSTHGSTYRLPLELFTSSTTHMKSSSLWGTSRTITQQSATALTDRVRAGAGDLTITSGQQAGQRIYEQATQDSAGGDIRYKGHSLLKEALIQVNSVHTQASGALRQSAAHQETASKTATVSLAEGNVIFDVVARVEASGWHIAAQDVEDYARESHLGALVKELRQMRSTAGVQRAGYTRATATAEQDTMIPTVLDLRGQYRAYARTEADKDGYVLWQGVIANMRGGYRIERRLIERAVDLKSRTSQTVGRVGFGGAMVDVATDLGRGHNPLDGLAQSFVSTTTAGGVQAYQQAEDDQDRAAAALRTFNSVFADTKDIMAVLTQREGALRNVLARIATIGLGVQSSHSTTHQTSQVPNQVQLDGDAEVLGPEWDHGQGAKLKTTKRVIAPNLKRFSMSAAAHKVVFATSSSQGGASYNLLTQGVGVELGSSKTSHTRTEHDAAVIEAGQGIFMRTEKMENTGGRGTAPIVDIAVTEDARHTTPVDTDVTTTRGTHLGVSTSLLRAAGQMPGPNVKLEDREVEARRLAAQKSGFTATQQFYYTVGGTSHEISAELGLRPGDQTELLTFKTQRGETFYHRPMPVSAADSTLQALFSGMPDMAVNPRAKVVIKLLAAKADPRVRQLIAQEIIQLIENGQEELQTPSSQILAQALEWNVKLQLLYQRLMRAVHAYNRAHGGDWLTAQEIIDRDPGLIDPAVRIVQEDLATYEGVYREAQAWAQSESTYQAFVQEVLAKEQYGIFPRPLRERVYKDQQSVFDVLAQLYGLDVVLYEPTEDGALAPVYQAKPLGGAGGSDGLSVNLLLITEEGERGQLQPHMDRLEGEREKIQVGQRIIEHHPEEAGEILRKSGIKINAPIGEIMLLIDNVKNLQAMMMENMHAEGVSIEEGAEALKNPELQQLTQEIAAITKEIDRKLHDQQIKQAAFKPKPKPPVGSGAGSSSGAAASASTSAVDPGLYDDITRRAQVDSPLRDLPLGSGSGTAAAALVDQPESYGQVVLEGLGYLKDRLERFIERNPRCAGAGEVLLKSLGYCLESAVILKGGIDGAAAGGAVGGRYGAVIGGALGMMVAYGAGQAVATAVEAGADQAISAAAAQGRTAGESARFAATAEWAAKSAMTLAMLAGARKAAVRWSGRGASAPSAPKKYESEFWKRQDTHEFFGQKNKVYKRDELIDLKVTDGKGTSNLELMRKGKPPIGPDGKPVNLHHLIQTQEGPLAEVAGSMHSKYHGVLHIWANQSKGGVTRAEARPKIDRQAFEKWKTQYWEARAKELSGE